MANMNFGPGRGYQGGTMPDKMKRPLMTGARPPTDFGTKPTAGTRPVELGGMPRIPVSQVPTTAPVVNDLAPIGTTALAPPPIGGTIGTVQPPIARPQMRPYRPRFRDPGLR